MKKIFIAGLIMMTTVIFIGCSDNNKDVFKDSPKEETNVTTVTYHELTKNEINSVILTQNDKYSEHGILDLTEEDVSYLYGKALKEFSDENTRSLIFKEGTFVFDKETKKLVSCVLTDSDMLYMRNIMIGYALNGIISKMPQDEEAIKSYMDSRDGQSEKEETNSYVLYNNEETLHKVILDYIVDDDNNKKSILTYSTDSFELKFDFKNNGGFELLEKITYKAI